MEQQQATAPRPDRPRRRPRPDAGGVPAAFVGVEQAEAALVEHYPRLTRLAYLVLPPTLGRNRRVLRAHSIVQRSLPRRGAPARLPLLPPQRRPGRPATDPGYAFVRLQVLRAALAAERPRLRLPLLGRDVPVPPLPPLLPQVWGLRLFPRSGGVDELSLARALSALSAPARAAYVLRVLEGSGDADVRAALEAAGAEDVPGALTAAAGAAPPVGGRGRPLLESAEFDPCSLQARPTDLLRRRRSTRATLAAGAAVLVCGALLTLPGGGRGPDGAAAPPYAENAAAQAALDPAKVTRAAAGSWRNATRRGLAAWPARGDRTHDRALLRRALAVWARPGPDVQVSATPGTAGGPAAGPPQLLYAGVADRAAVVLLYDGLRVVRYAEPVDASGSGQDGPGAALDFARTDGADDTSVSALVLSRTDSNVRYLTAPWTGHAGLTDLLKPADAAQPVPIGEDGATGPVPSPARATTCTAWQALRMDGHLFTDLGELVPARLTSGAPARPGEPDGPQARTAWARTACHLGELRGQGVRAVNSWEFAQQPLPAGGGTAVWVCTRAETWRGAGSRTFAQVQTPPTAGLRYAPGAVVARSEGGPGCGPREPWALAGVLWKASGGQWWLVAAGSGQLTEISVGGGVMGRAAGSQLAVPATAGARAELSGRLRSGERVTGLR
ncbi:hypothetical protein A6A06_10630 [Streptomyces sp. CB02923]|uniref:hypothetical protein n=1 Tax=Streptomyces sp. CB02923 TaxID=1718985 RepID=UPI000939E784|nr:hypothetical protein [Streptomyces sp. CB02923]OKI05097.1 hypothetical protein A6A06_10630 [Streptomyces sp. CB02923]